MKNIFPNFTNILFVASKQTSWDVADTKCKILNKKYMGISISKKHSE